MKTTEVRGSGISRRREERIVKKKKQNSEWPGALSKL
jgi:hypothetical protein